MYTQTKEFRKFRNQLNYLIGQILKLEIFLIEQGSNASVLHLVQTIQGGAIKLLKLNIKNLEERIYTLTNTPNCEKTLDSQTLSKLREIKKAVNSTRPAELPVIIDFLVELLKKTASESNK